VIADIISLICHGAWGTASLFPLNETWVKGSSRSFFDLRIRSFPFAENGDSVATLYPEQQERQFRHSEIPPKPHLNCANLALPRGERLKIHSKDGELENQASGTIRDEFPDL
jgi:hypothetical protein